MSAVGNIAKRWKKLSGMDNWKNLLHPLDIDLRRYLIHYGQMTQATYDTFISDRLSGNAGNTRYSMKNMFSRVGLAIANPFKYQVVKYFYATSTIEVPGSYVVKSYSRKPWNRESNWFGYVAVATDEGKAALGRRDIVIAWRGTIMPIEWYEDFEFPLVSASNIIGTGTNPQVHQGFLSLYTSINPSSPYNKHSARDQVLREVDRLMRQYENEETSLTVTGHSLGAAVATLNALDIVANRHNRKANKEVCPVTAFVYASPRVGDMRFRMAYDSLENLRLLRIENAPDIVPKVPLVTMGYVEIGNELLINTQLSNYLIQPGDIRSWHNLEVYLHGIAGSQGAAGFRLQVNRDIALLNKEIPSLKRQYGVPGAWLSLRNKGMVQMKDGHWKLHDKERNFDEAEDYE